MCKASSLLRDETSVNGYLELVRTWMKDTTSLIATSMKSGRVVGAVVARINSDPEKTDTYHRVQVRSRRICAAKGGRVGDSLPAKLRRGKNLENESSYLTRF